MVKERAFGRWIVWGRKKPNIYKIDNYLLLFGKLFVIVAAIAFLASLSDEEKKKSASAGDVAGGSFFLAGGVAMLAAGSRFRKKERKALALLNSLELAHEVSVPEFLDATGFTRADVETALRAINERGLGYYLWNRESDTIVDGRLKRRMVLADTCPACGKAVGMRYALDLAEIPVCPSCGSPFNVNTWNAWKLEAMRRLDKGEERKPGLFAGKKFSLPLFIVLLVVFWPAALVYLFFRVFKGETERAGRRS